MRTYLGAAAFGLLLAGTAGAAQTSAPELPAPPRDAASMQADAMKLCGRLAGTEREICVQQAQEHQRMADPDAVGATPGVPGGGIVPAPAPESGKPPRY